MSLIDVSAYPGLSSGEAARRLSRDGFNEIPSPEDRSSTRIILEVFREPMFILLVAAGSIYFLLGDIQEGVILLSFVFVIIGITVYQERKTERALEALRNLSSPRALVIRDGIQQRIAGREVVRGDLMLVSEGDRVAADAVLLAGVNLTVDESLLTGESVPVRKLPGDVKGKQKPGGDDHPWLYSGTLVVQGQGLAEVIGTGMNTEMGKIGFALKSVVPEKTRLHRETSRIVRDIALAGLFLCTAVIILYGIIQADWLTGFLAGITLAMAILPEEFPVVLTIFMALGAWRLSGHKVLTRSIPAIEELGSASVLCVDKTGTLTQNRMSIAAMQVGNDYLSCDGDVETELPERFHELLEYAILSSKKDPFDPMEQALLLKGWADLDGTEHLHKEWELVQEYPLSKELLAMSNVWKSREGRGYVIAAKGAPEAIADLSHLDMANRERADAAARHMAESGFRVLGVARSTLAGTELPDGQHDFAFQFLGLIGFADPVRPDAPAAVRDCSTAGIRVIMITGDYAATARYIGKEIGLPQSDHIITGQELEGMTGQELSSKVPFTGIFARVVPEQKLRIVNALKAGGEVVAMTGDGVNDAPALKAAHIGIAMGGRGTDVAREAASLVLLDDNFASIVAAVRMGRRIYANLRKAMAYILSVHVPIAGMSLIPVLLGMPLILLPVEIVFLELIIDPACSVVFEAEPEEADIMKRPPRDPERPIFDRPTVALALLQGLVVFGVVLAMYLTSLAMGLEQDQVRALIFTVIVIANLSLILTNRSWVDSMIRTLRRPNPAFWAITGATLIFLVAALSLPILREIFRFAPVPIPFLVLGGMAGFLSILWFEIFKLVLREKPRPDRTGEF
jgi:Ca2+-transporting ATPase